MVEAEERVDELLAAPILPGKLEGLGELPAHGNLQCHARHPRQSGTVGDQCRRTETGTTVVVGAVSEDDCPLALRNPQDNLAILELRELIRFECRQNKLTLNTPCRVSPPSPRVSSAVPPPALERTTLKTLQ